MAGPGRITQEVELGVPRAAIAPEDGVDFFISRAGSDRGVAQRIAEILEREGRYRVIIQDWDIGGANFVAKMDQALKRAERVISILSNSYLQSVYCAIEWQAVFASDPINFGGRLIVLRVDPMCQPIGLLATLAYADFSALDPVSELFRDAVLARVDPARSRTAADLAQPFMRRAGRFTSPGIRPTTNLIPRRTELLALEAALGSPKPLSKARAIAVVGMPGIGKTSIAREFGYMQQSTYAGVWEIDCSCENAIVDSLIALGSLFLAELGHAADRGAAARHTLMLATQNPERPWLFIFDGLEREELYRRWAPAAGADVVITTRNPTLSKAIARIALQAPPHDHAATFLLTESGREDITSSEAEALARSLDSLPLALAHAAAYLRDNPVDTVEDYRRALQARMKEAPADAPYPHSVYATFQAAAARAQLEVPLSRAVLALTAFWAPGDIPLVLLNSVPERAPDPARALTGNAEEVRRAINALCRLSLARFDPATRALHIGRVVQAAAIDQLGAESSLWAGAALLTLDRSLPEPDPQTWRDWESLLPHVQSVIEHYGLHRFDADSADFLSKVGVYAHQRGDFALAEVLFRRYLEIVRCTRPSDPAVLASALANLGAVLVARGEPGRARGLLEEALAIDEAAFGSHSPEIAESAVNLACALHQLHESDAARALLQRAADLLETSSEPGLLAKALADLGGVLRDCGEVEAAAPYFRRALHLNEATYGEDHVAVGQDLHNLAGLLWQTDRAGEARVLQSRSLGILAKALPPGHPVLVAALSQQRGL